MSKETYNDLDMTEHDPGNRPTEEGSAKRSRATLKKVTFDDFQITRAEQQAQVDEERKAWQERQDRMEKEKPSIIRFAVPRLKSLRDEMIGVQNKLPFFRKNQRPDVSHGPLESASGNGPYFADHERAVVHVTRRTREEEIPDIEEDSSEVLSNENESYAKGEILAEPMIDTLETSYEQDKMAGDTH